MRTVQALAVAQDLSDVARHDLMHLRDVLIELADVALRAGVQVQLLCLLYERVCVQRRVRLDHRGSDNKTAMAGRDVTRAQGSFEFVFVWELGNLTQPQYATPTSPPSELPPSITPERGGLNPS